MATFREYRGVITIWIVLLVTIPSLVFNILSCSDRNGKQAYNVSAEKINALCDTIEYISMMNAAISCCVKDDADSLERIHGESMFTGTIILKAEDIFDNSVTINTLLDNIRETAENKKK